MQHQIYNDDDDDDEIIQYKNQINTEIGFAGFCIYTNIDLWFKFCQC